MPVHSTSKMHIMLSTPPPSRSLDLLERASKAEIIAPGYQLESTLGAGACGIVYRARRLATNQVVALKVVTVDATSAACTSARFEKEIATLSKLDHPNIVKLYDSGRGHKQLYFAMELLNGEDLGQRIRRNGKLSERMTWEIIRQTAEALRHASTLGITHRDIKPANLFLVPPPPESKLPPETPMVKVTDFGLAMTAHGDGSDDRLTATGVVLGTPIYMSPEQFRMSKIDHRADIYSLGATAFHMLCGNAPFNGANVWDVMIQKMEAQPKLKEPVSDESIHLVTDMMVSDPDDRIESYEELIARIDNLAIFRDAPKTEVIEGELPHRRRWGLLAGLAVAIVGMALTQHLVRKAVHHYGGLEGDASSTQSSADESEQRYVPSGYFDPLFDGTTEGWEGGMVTLHPMGKTKVLRVYGSSQRVFTAPENFRLTYRIDLAEALAAEVSIPVRPGSGAVTSVRFNQDGEVRIGTRGDGGDFVQKGAPILNLVPKNSRGSYQEIRLEKSGANWYAFVNDTLVTKVPDVASNTRHAAVLADGGTLRLESLVREDLTKMR